jgi:hypothetical protein
MKKNIGIALMLVLVIVMTIALSLQSMAAAGELENSVSLSLSMVNQDPDPAYAGDIMEVRVGIENLGGRSANNVVIELVPDYPFELAPGEISVQDVGTLQAYQGYNSDNLKIIKYSVRVNRDATAGSYELKLKYSIDGSPAITKSLSVDVSNRESAEVIQIDKTTLVPGKQSSLTFMINNVGSAPLRDLTFSWVNDDKIILPVGSDNTKYVKYLDVGDSVDLQYQVISDSNVVAGLYELSLKLKYESTNGSVNEINTIAGVYVGGGTDFDIAFSESASGSTSFTIANIGSNPASSVSVIIPQQRGWSVTGANSMIIGNLNTGDYTVASFKLQSTQATAISGVSDIGNGIAVQDSQRNSTGGGFPRDRNWTGMQSQNTLNVQIAYTDTMGTRGYVNKTVAMASASSSGNSTLAAGTGARNFRGVQQQSFFVKYKNYIIWLVVIVIVAFAGITYGRYKKEKLIDPDFKFKQLFRKKEAPAKRK